MKIVLWRNKSLILLTLGIVIIFAERAFLAVNAAVPYTFHFFDTLTAAGSLLVMLGGYHDLDMRDWVAALLLGPVIGVGMLFADTPLDTVFPELGISLANALLAPHRQYFNLLYPHLSQIKALAHLTGGGFVENIPRVLPDNPDAVIHLVSWPVPLLWNLIRQKGNIAIVEMYRVFNMGIGMVAILDKSIAAEIQKQVSEETFIIGELVNGEEK